MRRALTADQSARDRVKGRWQWGQSSISHFSFLARPSFHLPPLLLPLLACCTAARSPALSACRYVVSQGDGRLFEGYNDYTATNVVHMDSGALQTCMPASGRRLYHDAMQDQQVTDDQFWCQLLGQQRLEQLVALVAGQC